MSRPVLPRLISDRTDRFWQASRGLLLFVLLLATAAPLGAQPPSGGTSVLVLPKTVQQIDGFRLVVQIENLDQQPGYLPLRIMATPVTGTFPADRTLTVRLDPMLQEGQRLGSEPAGVRLDLQLRQGQSRAARELLIPRWSMHSSYRVWVSQQGNALPGYAGRLGSATSVDWHLAPMALAVTSRIGVILAREVEDPEHPWQICPDLRALRSLHRPELLASVDLTEPLQSPRQRIAALRSGETAVQSVFSEEQLPEKWLGYDTLDILIAPLPLLERVAQQQPEQWRAVRQWVASGGNLWVFAAEDRQRVADLLQTAAAASTAADPTFAAAVGGFNLSAEIKELAQQARQEGGRIDPYAVYLPDLSREYSLLIDRNLSRLWQASLSTPRQMAGTLWVQPYLVGRVIVIAHHHPFPGSLQQWTAAQQLTQHRASAVVRRGVDVTSGSPRFWHWVLPNVARPPVYTFLGVLAAFAIMVGPLAYRRTTRAGRPYLMFLIAPALAVLTTVLMFGYGLVADGLGVQARIRQITCLDGRSGHGVRWARSTYFSGLPLSSGLTFPADAAVFPYPQDAEEGRGRGRFEEDSASTGRRVTLTGDHQHLSSSFLPSRTQRQFLSLQPIDSLGRIELMPPAPDAKQTLLRNTTAIGVSALIIRDATGDYWLAGKLPAGGTATAVRISPADAAGELRSLYNQQRPEPPAGFDTANRRLYGGTDWLAVVLRDYGWDQSATDGLFEIQLREWTQSDARLPAGSFLGTATVLPDALAIGEAKLSDSIHYVMGSLP